MPTKQAELVQAIHDAAAAWHADKGAPKWTLLTDAITALNETDTYYKEAVTGAFAPYQIVHYDGTTQTETIVLGGVESALADTIVSALNA